MSEGVARRCSIKKVLLAILTGKNFVILNSVQEFIEIKVWLLLSFFVCLHNQLKSIHPIVAY